jgi:hypothetical protein
MLARAIGAARLRSAAAPGPPAPFIVGVGRSGTTLLRMMLDAHREMAIPPETYFVPHLIAACARPRVSPEDVVATATGDEHRRWPDLDIPEERYLERLRALPRLNGADAVRAVFELYAANAGKPRWGDKTPDYVKRMPQIKRALPEARFIHVIRDGRDVMLSTYRRRAQRGRPLKPTGSMARRWRNQINRARHDSRQAGDYLEIRYEDLVTDTEPVLCRVCEFIELEFDPVMLRYYERAHERLKEMEREMPASGERPARPSWERLEAHALTTKPPSRDRIEVWREEMSVEDRSKFEQVAGKLLSELGYTLEGDEGASGLAS